MKRLLLTAIIAMVGVTATYAGNENDKVTKANFVAKVNLMDSYLGQHQLDNAKATWEEIHKMMMAEFNIIKTHVRNASNDAESQKYITLIGTEEGIYRDIWAMKPDLAKNREAIHARLLDFSNNFID